MLYNFCPIPFAITKKMYYMFANKMFKLNQWFLKYICVFFFNSVTTKPNSTRTHNKEKHNYGLNVRPYEELFNIPYTYLSQFPKNRKAVTIISED